MLRLNGTGTGAQGNQPGLFLMTPLSSLLLSYLMSSTCWSYGILCLNRVKSNNNKIFPVVYSITFWNGANSKRSKTARCSSDKSFEFDEYSRFCLADGQPFESYLACVCYRPVKICQKPVFLIYLSLVVNGCLSVKRLRAGFL